MALLFLGAVCALFDAVGVEGTVATDAYLIWHMTARDFLPSHCHSNFTELAELWDYGKFDDGIPYGFDNITNLVPIYPYSDDLTTKNRYRGNVSDYCPLWNDIYDGILEGHPDFEASTRVYGNGCESTETIAVA